MDAHGRANRKSCGDLLVGEGRNRHALAGVFDGYGAEATIAVEVQEGVLVQVPGLGHFGGAKLDVESVGLKEVGDFHGMNDLDAGAHARSSQ